MTTTSTLYNSVAPLRNVAALTGLVTRVQERRFGLPGLGVFYGFSGFGKTTAATYAANHFQAINIEVRSVWTTKKLCQALLHEMGLEPRQTVSDMVDQIAEDLARTGRPVLIDEADHLVKRRAIELVRDIHESSGAPIILIGEEMLPQKLQKWERVHGRVLDWVAAEPACAADVKHLAKIYATGLDLAEDFRQHLLEASHHSIRRVCVNLERAAEFATLNDLAFIDMAAWGERDFFATSAPLPRRSLA